MKKRVLSFILAVVMMASVVPANVSAEPIVSEENLVTTPVDGKSVTEGDVEDTDPGDFEMENTGDVQPDSETTKQDEILIQEDVPANPEDRFPEMGIGRVNPKTGYIGIRAQEVELTEEDLIEPAPSRLRLYAQSSNPDVEYWEQFGSRYYYNKLNSSQKALYDSLYSKCMGYLTSSDTIASQSGATGYFPWFVVSGLSLEEIKLTFLTFANENPQFYFVYGNGTYYAHDNYGNIIRATTNFMTEYASGSKRSIATQQIRDKINGWIEEINKIGSDYDKIKKIYEIVGKQITYSNAALSDGNLLQSYQSCAKAILEGNGVCASYTELYNFLASGAGIKAIPVTSMDHEWNQVELAGIWYNIDITWDDKTYGDQIPYNYYFLKGDTTFQKNSSHIPEAFYSGMRPECPIDFSFAVYTKSKIIYECNGGINSPSNPKEYYEGLSDIKLYPPTKANYVFDGWYLDREFNTPINVITLDKTGNITVYAKWRLPILTVNFNANGGVGSIPSVKIERGSQKIFPQITGISRDDYTFYAWGLNSEGNGNTYKPGNIIPNNYTDDYEINYYALWKHTEYNIIYNLNGGSFPEGTNQPKSYNSITATTLKNPVRIGYTFNGWFEKFDFSGSKITSIPVGQKGDKTFYAKWTANKYTISFNANGGTGTMASIAAEYDTPITLSENKFSRVGYTFVGWNTNKSANTCQYTDMKKVSNLTTSGTVTLYAVWEKIHKLTVKFDKNDSDAIGTKKDISVYLGEEISLGDGSEFSKSRHDFVGWDTDPNGNGVRYQPGTKLINDISKEKDEEIILYAQWGKASKDILPFYILFSGNGSTLGLPSIQRFSDTESFELRENTFKRKGYDFKGWKTTYNGEEVEFNDKANRDAFEASDIDFTKDKLIVLYAHWEPAKYEITYSETNGEKVNTSNAENYTILDSVTLVNDATKPGYTLAGWYSNKNLTTKVTTIKKGSTENKQLYAKWTPKKYTIIFDGNGATSGRMSNLTNREIGKNYTLTANAYKKEGYRFDGWTVENKKDQKDKASVNSGDILTNLNDSSVTLKAKWKIEDYNYDVGYKLNGGSDPNFADNYYYPRTYNKDTGIASLPSSAEKPGYTFAGWYTDEKLKTKITEIKIGSIGDKTLYAKWTPDKYSVVFEPGEEGITGSTKGIEVTYDKTFSLPANGFKKTGYTFDDWKVKGSYNISFNNKASVNDNSLYSHIDYDNKVTLVAQWKPTEYKITYKNITAGDYTLIGGVTLPEIYTVETPDITLPDDTQILREGYDFVGWYKESSFRNKISKIASYENPKPAAVTVYAKWIPHTYTVKYIPDDDGGYISPNTGKAMKDAVFTYGKMVNLAANAYKRVGYDFGGWKVEGASSNYTTLDNKQKVSDITSDNGAIVTLRAQWKPTEYKITYKNIHINETGKKSDSYDYYNIESKTFLLPNPHKEGYTFGGWYLDSAFKKPVDRVIKGSTGAKTFYAKWTAHKYKINFVSGNDDGANSYTKSATGTMKPISTSCGTTVTLTSVAFKREGYTFVGWKLDGVDTHIYDGYDFINKAKVIDLRTENGGEATLVAVWKPK